MMKSDVELRKIQITGGSTYIVSLPKDWAESLGLRPGDYLHIVRQPDMSLLIIPKEARIEEPSRILIDATSSSPEEVVREFIACYLTGYDLIELKFGKRVDEYKVYLKRIMRNKLIGLETIEESTDHMTVRCLLGYMDFPIKDAINRMHVMVISMCRDAVKALESRDPSLAKDVVQRDDEVDRLYLFIVRGLKMAVENRLLMKEIGLTDPRECLGYRLIVKSMERIADHALRIAKMSMSTNMSNAAALVKKILSMGRIAFSIYENSIASLFNRDLRRANKTLNKIHEIHELESKIIKEMLSSKLDIKTITGLRLILESVRRIAEYGADIAEIVINLAIKP